MHIAGAYLAYEVIIGQWTHPVNPLWANQLRHQVPQGVQIGAPDGHLLLTFPVLSQTRHTALEWFIDFTMMLTGLLA
jgi:hypothetical protein